MFKIDFGAFLTGRLDVAYDEVMDGYVNLNSPKDSELYTKIAPGGSMEQYATAQERTLILQ